MTTNSREAPPPKVVTTARGYTRTIQARLVEFRCEWCSSEQQVWQYPGAAPRYCSVSCHKEAGRVMNAARQRERRERKRRPYGRRRPVGRPRQL